jgi:hypothetical protein
VSRLLKHYGRDNSRREAERQALRKAVLRYHALEQKKRVNERSWLQTVLNAYSPAPNMALCGFDAEESDSQFVFGVPMYGGPYMAWHLRKVRSVHVEHIQHNP